MPQPLPASPRCAGAWHSTCRAIAARAASRRRTRSPAFHRALEIGVTTLETDLAVTQGRRPRDLARSRSQSRSRARPRRPRGSPPGPADPLADARRASSATTSAGSIRRATTRSSFPSRSAADGERFPTLAELFALARRRRSRCASTSRPRSRRPAPTRRVDAASVRAARRRRDPRRGARASRTTIQSFDWRTLVEAKRLAPEIATACLTIESAEHRHGAARSGRPSPWHAGLDLAAHGGSLPRLATAAGCARVVALLAQRHARPRRPRRTRSASRWCRGP